MKRIGDDVGRELGRLGPQGAIADVVRVWPAAVGEAIAANAWPARIGRDGTLHVATASSAWAFELAQLAPTVLARLRDALQDGRAPASLRFAPGPLPAVSAAQGGSPAAVRTVIEPTAGEIAIGQELAAPIADSDLRALVARAAAVGIARRS